MNNSTEGLTPLENKLFLSYYVILLVFTVAGNTLVCVAIFLDRRLRSPTNYFIASLAISDLLYGVVGLSFRIAAIITPMPGTDVCSVWIWADMVCAAASIANLAVISIDRYLKIAKPFGYDRNVTKKRSFTAIAGVWIYAAILATFSIIKWPNSPGVLVEKNGFCVNESKIFYTVANIVAFLLPLLIILVSYSLIFRTALIQFNKMKDMLIISSNRDERHKQRSVIRDFKATKTLAIVLGTFTVCWAPFFLLFTIQLYKRILNANMSKAVSKFLFFAFFLILPNLNSACNPIIYAYFNAEYRRAFRKILWSTCDNHDSSRHNFPRRKSSITSFFQSTFVVFRRGSPQNHIVENNNQHNEEHTFLNGTTVVTEV